MNKLLILCLTIFLFTGCKGGLINAEVGPGKNKRLSTNSSAPVFCTTGNSMVVRDAKVSLTVWNINDIHSSPESYKWKSDSGTIEKISGKYRWNLTGLDPGEYTAHASDPDFSDKILCTVSVTIKQQLKSLARRSLLSRNPEQTEEPGFGAYSYILFSPPRRQSDVKKQAIIMETYLKSICAISDIDDFRLKRQINVVYIPVKTLPEDNLFEVCGYKNQEAAEARASAGIILEKYYDYDRSTFLLELLGKKSYGGPYLITSENPVSRIEELNGTLVEIDLSRLPQHVFDIIPEWMLTFFSVSGQQRNWSQENIKLFAYKLRVTIAIISKGVDDIETGVSRLVTLRDKFGKLVE